MFDLKGNEEPDTRSEEECFPNIDTGIEVAGDRVLVQLRREKSTSKGGIILVDETRQTLRFNETVAKVVQVGPLAYRNLDEGLTPWPEGPWCKEGDFVRIPKFGGDRFERKIPNTEDTALFCIFSDHEIIAKVDPAAFEELDELL